MKPFSGSVIGYSGDCQNPRSHYNRFPLRHPPTQIAPRSWKHGLCGRSGDPFEGKGNGRWKKGGNGGNGGIGHGGFVKSPVVYMGVSKNNGTSKSSTFRGFSIINHSFWGTPIFGNTDMLPNIWSYTLAGQKLCFLSRPTANPFPLESFCQPGQFPPQKSFWVLSLLDLQRGDNWPCHTCHTKWTW